MLVSVAVGGWATLLASILATDVSADALGNFTGTIIAWVNVGMLFIFLFAGIMAAIAAKGAKNPAMRFAAKKYWVIVFVALNFLFFIVGVAIILSVALLNGDLLEAVRSYFWFIFPAIINAFVINDLLKSKNDLKN
jgi:hypothetical protein